MILPERGFGSLSINSISRGNACAARCFLTNWAISSLSFSEGLTPSFNFTKALIISPRMGSGFPITPASTTDGCDTSADSTSNGPTRSPEVFISRIDARTNNDFGKGKSEQEHILSWHKNFEKRMIDKGAVPINTEQPIEAVAEIIFRSDNEPRNEISNQK